MSAPETGQRPSADAQEPVAAKQDAEAKAAASAAAATAAAAKAQAEYEKVVHQIAPPSLSVFIASLGDSSRDTRRSAATHLLAEDMSVWAKPAEVAAFLGAGSVSALARLAFVKELALGLGDALAILGELSFGDAVCVLPCIGCSTPYDAGGCRHEGTPPRVKPPRVGTAAELADSVHEAHLRLTLAISLLTWRAPADSDLLLDCFLQLPPSGVDPREWADTHLQRGDYLLALPMLLSDAVSSCARTLPKLASLSMALLSVIVSRRPEAALSTLKPAVVEVTVFEWLGEVFSRVARTDCLVEERFGMGQLQDALPLLYHLGDWPEAVSQAVKPKPNALPALLASLTVNMIHDLANADDPPLETMLPQFPEVRTAGTRVGSCFGNCELLRDRPGAFTVGCLVEILGRWACRGIPVGSAATPSSPLPEQAATMSARELREHVETAQTMFAEYEERFSGIVRRTPALAVVQPIFAAIAHGTKPELPPVAGSLLRGPLHAHMRCALPGCDRTTDAESGGRLKMCSGGCGGLARYCCTAHARQNWPHHKPFCSR